MSRVIRIPVQVRSGMEQWATDADPFGEPDEAPAAPVPLTGPLRRSAALATDDASDAGGPGVVSASGNGDRAPAAEQAGQIEATGTIDWRDRALRLQAEMDNYRKRQQRLAQDSIDAERQRLLRRFLPLVDDLERALAAQPGDGRGLREGIHLTYQAAQQLLRLEGIEPVGDQGQPFDPNWHEAVATVDHARAGVAAGTIVEVVEPGYRQGDQLLRPAKVVVAV